MKKNLLFLAFAILSVSAKAQFAFNLNWASSVGGTGIDAGTHVFTDAAGNVYTTGYFESTCDFDPGPGVTNLTSSGSEDVFIMKQSSNGNLIWAKAIGGANTDMPAGIGVDNSGNVYVSGFYGGVVDLDPSAASYTFFAGSIEVFVVKLDGSGNFVWGQSMGSGGNDKAMTMCVDGSGNVYTAGYFEGMMDFDPGAGTYNITPFGSMGDIFVSKLTSAGNFAWAVNLGGVNVENPNGICVDASANVYVTGFFEDVSDFDPGVGTFTLDAGAAGRDAFVCKLDGNGNFVWAKQFGGTGDQHGYSVIMDVATNAVYVSGDYQNTTDLDPGAGTFTVSSTSAFYSGFAVKLNPAGVFQWGKNISGTDDVLGNCSRVNINGGSLNWAGYFKGTADLDPGTGTHSVTAVNGIDSYLTVLDAGGNHIISESFPYLWGSFVITPGSNLILTGKYSGTQDFAPSIPVTNMTSAGQVDACIVNLNAIVMTVKENDPSNGDILLYPNPSNGQFKIGVKGKSTIRIVNALGQIILSKEFERGVNSIDLKEKGIYFLHSRDENGKQTCTKFVIEN